MIEGVGNVSHPLFLYYYFGQSFFWSIRNCIGGNFDIALSCKSNNGARVYFNSCMYMATISELGSCFGGDSCQYYNDCGSIEQYTALENVSIYPNPNNGSFVIEPSSATKQTMQVYDVTGKLVLSQTLNGKTNIDASSLSEGIYNISIINSNGVVNKRLVIVR
jgi:type IX secretion system substrate protein